MILVLRVVVIKNKTITTNEIGQVLDQIWFWCVPTSVADTEYLQWRIRRSFVGSCPSNIVDYSESVFRVCRGSYRIRGPFFLSLKVSCRLTKDVPFVTRRTTCSVSILFLPLLRKVNKSHNAILKERTSPYVKSHQNEVRKKQRYCNRKNKNSLKQYRS